MININKPLPLLATLLALFTSSVFAIESIDLPTSSSCNTSFSLPNNQWRLIFLPCDPGEANTVAEVFGDDTRAEWDQRPKPLYSTDWVVYKYDTANHSYIKLNETDVLEVGIGYWIIQHFSRYNFRLDLPTNSTPLSSVKSPACPSLEGCYSIPLQAQSNAMKWNIVGRPFHFSFKPSDIQIQTSTPDCADGCNLDIAQQNTLVQNELWTYNGSSYTLVNTTDGRLDSWSGYWVSTLESADGSNPTLLIPRLDAPITREELIEMIRRNDDVTKVNTSQITDMSRLFNFTSFNQDISGWDVSNVTTMSQMFTTTYSFNQDISSWDVSNVTDMSFMFGEAFGFNQDISSWNVSNVTDMSSMFSHSSFNQDISRWDVSHVTDMSDMFRNSNPFNQNINSWDVSHVTDMSGMFESATHFDQNISSWDVSNVNDMSLMFEFAASFNQDLSRWNVSNVKDMSSMFKEAFTFNQNIGSWNVSNVTSMGWMFYDANNFTNQDLRPWNVSNVTNHTIFLNGAGTGNTEPNWP